MQEALKGFEYHLPECECKHVDLEKAEDMRAHVLDADIWNRPVAGLSVSVAVAGTDSVE